MNEIENYEEKKDTQANRRRSKKKRKKHTANVSQNVYREKNTKTFFYQLVRFIKYFRAAKVAQ